VYVVVLGAAMLVSVIGVSSLLLQRTEFEVAGRLGDAAAARLAAQSSIGLVLQRIHEQPAWWQGAPLWIDGQTIASAAMSATVTPVGLGTAGPGGAFLVRGTGVQGPARQIWEMRVEYDPVSPMCREIYADGPLAHWPLGELSGSIAQDASEDHHGQYRGGMPLGGAGRVPGDAAPSFDGIDDFIEVPHDGAFMLDQGSVELWFSTPSVAVHQGLVSKDASGRGSGQFSLTLEGKRVNARLESAGSAFRVQSVEVSAGAWHHVVMTFGPGGLRLYVDGALAESNAYTGGLAMNTQPLAIGVSLRRSADGSTAGWEDPFAGRFDDVVVYRRALSPQRVLAHHRAGAMAARWVMREGSWERRSD
jgi:hypothetical protein